MSNSQTEPVLGSSSETSPGNQKKTRVKLVCDLLSANNRLVEDRRKAADQLRKNRDQFLFYAEQHRAKTTATRPIPMSPKEIEDTLNKALVNESFAAEITAILETISPR